MADCTAFNYFEDVPLSLAVFSTIKCEDVFAFFMPFLRLLNVPMISENWSDSEDSPTDYVLMQATSWIERTADLLEILELTTSVFEASGLSK